MREQPTADTDELPVLRTLAELREHVDAGVFVRYSGGPVSDQVHNSRDYESGLDLPGLSVNPLEPEAWWTRDVDEWLARQLCNYVHLLQEADDERRAWILRGQVIARGPDNEPLVGTYEPLAWLSEELIDEARRLYEERFDVAADST